MKIITNKQQQRRFPNTIIGLLIILAKSISTSSCRDIGIEMRRSPESAVAPLGDEVLFECELNLALEKVEWRFKPIKNKDNIIGSIYITNQLDRYNISTENNVTRLKVYVTEKAIGEYQCIVWFGAIAIASIPAKLILADISLNVSRFDKSNQQKQKEQNIVQWEVPAGNTILINCGEVISNPEPAWTFFKDDRPFFPKYRQAIPGTLILQSVTHQDSGTYYCSATNPIIGADVKLPQKTIITVKDELHHFKPKFIGIPPQIISASPGSTAILECPGIGNPIPKATWSSPNLTARNSKLLGSDNRTKILEYGLELRNVRKEDSGTYFCSLDNGEGVLVHQTTLQILQFPTIIHGPKATLTNESGSLLLECIADGFPVPKMYWMINGVSCEFDNQTMVNGSKLFIKSVEKRHAGIVQCFARNSIGEVTKWNLLRVNPKQISGEIDGMPLGTLLQSTKLHNDHTGRPPKKKHRKLMVPPSAPSITRLSDNSVMVRWSVPSNDGLPIQFFKVQHRIIGNAAKTVPRTQWVTANDDIKPHERSYEVDNLKPDLVYRFRIAAVYSNNDNELGSGSQKFLLQRGSELNLEKTHLPIPKLLNIEPVSDNTIAIYWKFTNEAILTPVDGFYLYYRPASTAGDYSKATIDGMDLETFNIDHLEPGTAYEFKLQSFTSSAASDFSAILTGKTLKSDTLHNNITPIVISSTESKLNDASFTSYIIPVGGTAVFVIILLICVCFGVRNCKNSSNEDDATTDNKIQRGNHLEINTNYSSGRAINTSNHKRSGDMTIMNIVQNPLSQDCTTGLIPDGGEIEKNRNIMELRFIPTSKGNTTINGQAYINHNTGSKMQSNSNHVLTLGSHLNGLEYGLRSIDHSVDLAINQKCALPSPGHMTFGVSKNSKLINSPHGTSSDHLHYNRSPIPNHISPAFKQQRHRLGSCNENMSSGSLNSIEV